jgi:hypothetical protein
MTAPLLFFDGVGLFVLVGAAVETSRVAVRVLAILAIRVK